MDGMTINHIVSIDHGSYYCILTVYHEIYREKKLSMHVKKAIFSLRCTPQVVAF